MKKDTLALYAQAAEELTSETFDRGLYYKAFCECSGDEPKTRAAYIQERYQQLATELAEQESRKQREEFHQRLVAWNHNRMAVRRRSSAPKASHPNRLTHLFNDILSKLAYSR